MTSFPIARLALVDSRRLRCLVVRRFLPIAWALLADLTGTLEVASLVVESSYVASVLP